MPRTAPRAEQHRPEPGLVPATSQPPVPSVASVVCSAAAAVTA
ncbi:hypothetical protein [Catenulispora sp. MAP12-49]